MSNTIAEPLMPSGKDRSISLSSTNGHPWLRVAASPVWACFLVALLVRLWLIVHTQGVIAGDEAVVGLQAENIVRGQFPVYYYSQPYMGSLQAYIIAFLFLFTGPAVWAMRIEPLLISLLIVSLTWRFSATLADAALLSARTKQLFMIIATLIAAFAPLYDIVEEMRVTGGYVEVFTVMLWLLFCALRLTQRWHERAARRELAWRWSGLGFLAGVGLWIDPLIMYAYATIALWISGYFLLELLKRFRHTGSHSPLNLLKEALLSASAVPTTLLGFAPGLFWGARHHWANITYIFRTGAPPSSSHLQTLIQVGKLYATCLAPRALGGALPTQPDVTTAHPQIVTVGFVVVGASLIVSVAGIVLSLYSSHTLFLRIRQLTLLPLLFVLCASAIFCTASISVLALLAGCGPWDVIGRYAVPLVVAIPFIVAAAVIVPLLLLQEKQQTHVQESEGSDSALRPMVQNAPLLRFFQSILILMIVIYFLAQGVAYVQASPNYTFQASGCVGENPTDLGPIISYMQRSHIRYAWAVGWIADPITFETNTAILVTQPGGRILANNNILLHADRASIFVLARHNDAHPAFLQELDTNNVTYHIERFSSAPGIDVLLITPLNRTVSPLNPAFTHLFQQVFGDCWRSGFRL
ncbi:MAG: hypothetical protein H0W02_04955 [Ktedonobacteraceae bacterium]|nr:hypothetical protein [Ktedonobacteraceae bacterium]